MKTDNAAALETVTRGPQMLAPKCGVPILLPIPHVGRGKRRGNASFSLISHGRRTACASRPPTLTATQAPGNSGGSGSKATAADQGKRTTTDYLLTADLDPFLGWPVGVVTGCCGDGFVEARCR